MRSLAGVTTADNAPRRLTSFRDAVVTAATLDVVARGSALSVAFLSARTLEPAEIGTLGLVGAGTAIVSMLGSFIELGAIISGVSMDEKERANAAGALRMMVVAPLLVGAFFFLDRMLEAFLVEPTRMGVARYIATVLMTLPVFEAIAGIPVVYLQRTESLQSVALRQAWQPLTYAGLGALALLAGFGTSGLAWAQVFATAGTASALWLLALQKGLTLKRIKPVSLFPLACEGFRQASAGLIGFMTERVDNLLVAGSLGTAALGYYSLAWSASRLPIYVLSRVCRSAILPTLLRTHDVPEEQRRMMHKSLALALAASCGFGVLIALLGRDLVVLVLGARWLPAGACLEVLSLTVALSPLAFLGGTYLQAQGKAHKVGPFAGGVQIGLQLALIPFACAILGERGAAWVDGLAFGGMTFVVLYWTRKTEAFKPHQVVEALSAPLVGIVAATTMAILGGLGEPKTWSALVVSSTSIFASYMGGCMVTSRDLRMWVVQAFRS